jgi:hypothetical protein
VCRPSDEGLLPFPLSIPASHEEGGARLIIGTYTEPPAALGEFPRDLIVTPDGRHVIVACQNGSLLDLRLRRRHRRAGAAAHHRGAHPGVPAAGLKDSYPFPATPATDLPSRYEPQIGR